MTSKVKAVEQVKAEIARRKAAHNMGLFCGTDYQNDNNRRLRYLLFKLAVYGDNGEGGKNA